MFRSATTSLCASTTRLEGYPLFADNYIDKIARFRKEKVVNIFMELSAIGVAQPLSSHIA